MPSATITIEDAEGGNLTVSADYGDVVFPDSPAHQAATVLLNSVLSSAATYKQVEDTATEMNAEPSRIVTPE